MSVELWPCHACDTPGIRNVGADGYCSTHLAELYNTFDPSSFVNGGIGLPAGMARSEYGPGIEDLRCCRCEATWSGVCGDRCWWCQRGFQIQTEHQVDLLLTPPEVDPADVAGQARVDAWIGRLAVGVKAGLITQHQARAAGRPFARAA